MADKSTYIAQLWFKSLEDSLTEKEKQEWEAWLSDRPEHRQMVNELTDPVRLKNEVACFRDENMAEKLQELTARLFPETAIGTGGLAREEATSKQAAGPRSFSFQGSWLKYAAVLIVIAGTSLFVWLGGRSSAENVDPAGEGIGLLSDIQAPEGNKARLLLADGSIIALDTLAEGVLSQGEHTSVMKLSDGQLIYNTNNAFTGKPVYNTIITPRGGHYQVSLPDGTRVWLNAASSLRFPTAFTENNRTVELKGEAYFDVTAAHPSPFPSGRGPVPFTVVVNNMKVQVLGTQFNIKAYEEEPLVRTTLAEGKLAVSAGSETVLLNPSEQAVLNDAGGTLSKVNADLYKELAWMNGMFVFDDDDITNIMGELSRWYDVDVSIEGDILNSHYSGVIRRSENISQVLNMLKTAGGINFIIEDRNIKVLPDM